MTYEKQRKVIPRKVREMTIPAYTYEPFIAMHFIILLTTMRKLGMEVDLKILQMSIFTNPVLSVRPISIDPMDTVCLTLKRDASRGVSLLRIEDNIS